MTEAAEGGRLAVYLPGKHCLRLINKLDREADICNTGILDAAEFS